MSYMKRFIEDHLDDTKELLKMGMTMEDIQEFRELYYLEQVGYSNTNSSMEEES